MHRSSLRTVRPYLRAALAVAVLSATLGAPAPARAVAPTFSITGKGWGHGIGLSQYGARGYARAGWSCDSIVTWYFQGTTVGPVTTKVVTVNLEVDKARRPSWTLRAGWAGERLIVNGVPMPDDHAYRFEAAGTSLNVIDADVPVAPTTYAGTVTVACTAPSGQPALVMVDDDSGPFNYNSVRWRGSMRLDSNSTGVRLDNVVDIEDYLKGVVPREMPASWETEAVKAQAVAARSYAYVSSGELYCDTHSQMYGGHSRGTRATTGGTPHEDSRSNAAVDATSGRCVLYGGSVVQAFFSSYSGGHTANIEDVWTGSAPRSYYVGVDDADVAGGAPASWGAAIVKTSAEMGTELTAYDGDSARAVPVLALGPELAPSGSGFVKYVNVSFANGRTARITGDQFRSALGLKSTKFEITAQGAVPLGSATGVRFDGADRWDTMQQAARDAFPGWAGVTDVVVACGDDRAMADPLSASGLAGAYDCPLLLVRNKLYTNGSPLGAAGNLLLEMGRVNIHVVGGPVAVSPAVYNELAKSKYRKGGTIERFNGANRYNTAEFVAKRIVKVRANNGTPVDGYLVANGAGTNGYYDALALAPVAYARHWPLLLTRAGDAPGETTRQLGDFDRSKVWVAGNAANVSANAMAMLRAPESQRIAGADRYGTAVAIADTASTKGWAGYTNVAVGASLPDALAGGASIGSKGGVLLYTPTASLPASTTAALTAHKADIAGVWVLGGEAAVSDNVWDQIAAALGP